jgi:hypothetical protein
MAFFDRRGRNVRAFAVFFTVYCAIASARALIPGLCATLTELEHRAGAICESPDHACCRTKPNDGQTRVSAATSSNHCAFCALVHAVAHLVTIPDVVRSRPATPYAVAAHDAFVPNSVGTDSYRRRGPPIA